VHRLSGRRYRSGRDFRRAITIEELRSVARRRLPAFSFEYLEGGSEDELTLRRNREVFAEWRFCPEVLVDTAARHARVELFGRTLEAPVVLAPTGLNGMLWREGDVALARAAAAHGVPFTLSTLSNARVERVARVARGGLWMQLYVFNDRRITEDILARAAEARCEALLFTVDTNVFGGREWDQRNFRAPGKLTLPNIVDAALHPGWAARVLWPRGIPRFENVADYLPAASRTASGGVTIVPRLFSPTITWDDVAWLRQAWSGHLLIKGVLSVGSARRAADLGCDGIVLSNHGGRQLDSCVSPIETLPKIVEAVGDRVTILVDSGFRRGNDVLKALALGARAVMLGRATLYGLAAGGEAGACHALQIVKGEILRGLGLLGCRSIDELGPHLLRR
jgi:(S)-mandelate dehydrogenase